MSCIVYFITIATVPVAMMMIDADKWTKLYSYEYEQMSFSVVSLFEQKSVSLEGKYRQTECYGW